MNRPLLLVSLCCLLAGLTVHAAEEEREWTFTVGKVEKKVTARLEAIVKGEALLKDKAGKEYKVPLANFPKEQSKDALIQVVGSGVVVVHANDVLDQPAGVGSGFVIMKSGFILTNYHVIRGAGSIEVAFRDHPEKLKAECWGVDRAADVAVLKVAELPAGTHVLELAVKTPPRQGENVWTIGHPQRLKNTVSWGDVNAVRQTTDLPDQIRKVLSAADDTRWIQTDAVLSQGSSGGPLLNADGQALGMNTFIMGPQLGFAVHLQHARVPFQQAREAQQPIALPMPPEKKESALAWLSREVAPILNSYKEEMETLKSTLAGAQPKKIQETVLATNAKFRPQLLQIAKQDPAGWPAFQALLYTCSLSNDGSEDADKSAAEACNLLLKHHPDSEELGQVLGSIAELDNEDIRKFSRHLLEKSPHPAVQVQAAFMIARGKLQWLANEGGMNLEETLTARKEIEGFAVKLDTDFKKVDLGGTTGTELATLVRESLAEVPIGLPAKEIAGIDHEGKTFKLSEYKGKVILLDFFADWCPWCRKMYESERAMVENLKAKPFALLGVHCENQAVLQKLTDKKTVTWRSWADGAQGPIATEWEVNSFPCLYLLDHNGLVRRKFSGAPTEADLNDAIAALVKEAESPAGK